jgi:hypothetical protein
MSVYFMTIWNILWPFGVIQDHLVCGHLLFFPNLECLDQKNLATLHPTTTCSVLRQRTDPQHADVIKCRTLVLTTNSAHPNLLGVGSSHNAYGGLSTGANTIQTVLFDTD